MSSSTCEDEDQRVPLLKGFADMRGDMVERADRAKRDFGEAPVWCTPVQIRAAAGVAAVRDALFPGALADDVARILAGRTTFPRQLWGEVL